MTDDKMTPEMRRRLEGKPETLDVPAGLTPEMRARLSGEILLPKDPRTQEMQRRAELTASRRFAKAVRIQPQRGITYMIEKGEDDFYTIAKHRRHGGRATLDVSAAMVVGVIFGNLSIQIPACLHAIGLDLAAAVQTVQHVPAADMVLGVDFEAPVRVETDVNVSAAPVVGVELAAAVETDMQVPAAFTVGAEFIAIIEAAVDVSAAPVVGAEFAAAVETDVEVVAAPVVGIELAAAVETDVQVAAALIVGAELAASSPTPPFIPDVETDVHVFASPVVGVELAATVQRNQHTPQASPVVGVEFAAIIHRDVHILASPVVGVELAAIIQRNQHTPQASPVVGVELAATINRDVHVIASPVLGVELAATITKADNDMAPIGGISLGAFTRVPANYLACDGTAVSRTTYASLFNVLVYSSTVTISNGSPGVVTWANHGLTAGDPVKFYTNGTLPSPLVAGTPGTGGQIYYVLAAGLASGTFRISATPGGAAINTTTNGSGTHTAVNAPWGDGDNSTTFNLPELQGEFPRFYDVARGVDSNRGFGADQLDALQGHKHSATGTTPIGGSAGTNTCASANTSTGTVSDTITVGNPTTDGTNGTPRTAAETRPRNQALLAIVRFQ